MSSIMYLELAYLLYVSSIMYLELAYILYVSSIMYLELASFVFLAFCCEEAGAFWGAGYAYGEGSFPKGASVVWSYDQSVSFARSLTLWRLG